MSVRISKLLVGLTALTLSAALTMHVEAARGGGGGRSGGHNGGHGGGHGHGHNHSHTSVGVFFGAGWYPYYYYPPYPGYYYPPYYYPYYYPPAASAPTTYIELGATESGGGNSLPSGYWYYCNSSNGYYPYVKECSGGWQQVAPTPAK